MSHARKGNASSFSHAGFAHPKRNVTAFGLMPGMRVADFGSGSGAYVLAIAEALGGSGHVYAIDIQKDLLRRTHNEAQKAGYQNVQILWGDLEAPGGSKIADNSLDRVLISNLLFQVSDPKAVIAEARRVVKSSGSVVIIDWEESFGGMGPHPEDIVSKQAALDSARSAGLVFAEEFNAGAHHYGLIFRKGE